MRGLAALLAFAAALSLARGELISFRSLLESSPNRTVPRAGPYGIVPDVVDRVKQGASLLAIYNSTSVDSLVLAPAQAARIPQYNATGVKPGGRYLLLMVDPDAPSARDPSRAQVLHLMISNIRVPAPARRARSAAVTLPLAAGTVVTSYAGPNPPAGMGVHRYVSLLYRQPGKHALAVADPSDGGTTEGRRYFSTRRFAKQYRLGDPVAVSLFFSYNA